MKITAELLVEKGATCDQVDLFKQTFPKGAVVNLKNCLLAAERGLDIDWAAENLLSKPAWKVYNETRAPARKVCDETCAPARKVYDETWAQARKVCDETWAQARKVYDETCAQAWKVYNETCARGFYRAMRKNKNLEEGK